MCERQVYSGFTDDEREEILVDLPEEIERRKRQKNQSTRPQETIDDDEPKLGRTNERSSLLKLESLE